MIADCVALSYCNNCQ